MTGICTAVPLAGWSVRRRIRVSSENVSIISRVLPVAATDPLSDFRWDGATEAPRAMLPCRQLQNFQIML